MARAGGHRAFAQQKPQPTHGRVMKNLPNMTPLVRRGYPVVYGLRPVCRAGVSPVALRGDPADGAEESGTQPVAHECPFHWVEFQEAAHQTAHERL